MEMVKTCSMLGDQAIVKRIKSEVRRAMKRIKRGKGVNSDDLPVEV